MNITLLLIGIVLDTAFIIYDDKKHGVASIFLKTLASLMFVLLGIINNKGGLTNFIISALVFDMLGDFVLILRNVDKKHKDLLYIVGTLFFFVAHVFLSIYLCKENPKVFIPGLLVTTILFVIFGLKFINSLDVKGPLKIVGTIYLYFIVLTWILSLVLMIFSISAAKIVMMLALLLFTFSDFVLVTHKFSKKSKPYMQPLYRVAYYISQLMLVLYICLK